MTRTYPSAQTCSTNLHNRLVAAGGLDGKAITTGSWTGLRYFPPGTTAHGEFVGLGAVEASF